LGHKGVCVSEIRDKGTFDRDVGTILIVPRDKIGDIGTLGHKLNIKREMSHVPHGTF